MRAARKLSQGFSTDVGRNGQQRPNGMRLSSAAYGEIALVAVFLFLSVTGLKSPGPQIVV